MRFFFHRQALSFLTSHTVVCWYPSNVILENSLGSQSPRRTNYKAVVIVVTVSQIDWVRFIMESTIFGLLAHFFKNWKPFCFMMLNSTFGWLHHHMPLIFGRGGGQICPPAGFLNIAQKQLGLGS